MTLFKLYMSFWRFFFSKVWMTFFETWIESSPARVQWNLNFFFAYTSYLVHLITNMGQKPNQALVQFQLAIIQLFPALGISSDYLSVAEVREIVSTVGVLDVFEVSHVTAIFRNHGSNLYYTNFGKSNTEYYVKNKHETKMLFYLIFGLKDGVSLNFIYWNRQQPNQGD